MIKATFLSIAVAASVGCGVSGLDEARAACQSPLATNAAGFDPESEPLGSLMAAADAAERAAVFAGAAADAHDRWLSLAAAGRAVAAFAGVLVDARTNNVPIAEATTPQMWQQAKLAADAFSAECRMLPE